MWTLALVTTALGAEGCDAGRLARGLEAIERAPSADRAAVATLAFAVACEGPFALALRDVAGAPPEQRDLFELRAVSEAPVLWMEVCGGAEGLRVVADLAALPPERKRSWLWARCDLARQAWVSEGEWMVAPGPLLASQMAGRQLGAAGVEAGVVRRYVRGIAGLKTPEV